MAAVTPAVSPNTTQPEDTAASHECGCFAAGPWQREVKGAAAQNIGANGCDFLQISSKEGTIRLRFQFKFQVRSKRRLMMKRFVWISTLLFAVAFATALLAQEQASGQVSTSASAPATAGTVTVAFNAAVLQTAEAQRELNALQTKYAPRQAKIKSLNDEVTELQKQLQATSDKLSDAERASREQTLSTKEKQLQRDADDFKADSQTDSQQVFQNVAQKMYTFLQTYAQQHSYSMVIDRGNNDAPVIWYVAANLDITDALVKAYNAQAGAAKAVPSAPTPQKTPPPAPK
jgi:outer membrane protein